MQNDNKQTNTNLIKEVRLKADAIRPNQPTENDGIDRRGFLSCMAWAGTGMLWTVAGGMLGSALLPRRAAAADMDSMMSKGSFSFVQISDSHIGFHKDAINKDVVGTLKQAIARINAMPVAPDFVLHTGDLTHLASADEFDTVDQLMKTIKTQQVLYVPGEHDVTGDNGKAYLDRFGKNTKGQGWYSFDHNGVHFIGLVNVVDIQQNGLGALGQDQLTWLQADLQDRSSETPIVIFAHIPLWMVYPEWGWGTDDGAQALTYLKRFGSVTVLNGHIHQVVKKVEGRMTFHTAMSTAFPQPEAGKAPKPGPMKVDAGKLNDYLGVTDVNYVEGKSSLAVVDTTLS
jgi:3',5'-cyclic AMP phosphodiesterase CpdA